MKRRFPGQQKQRMTSIDLAQRIRRGAVEMTHSAHASHVGAMLSAADIIAVLYADIMRYDALNPDMAERDRFILSKGHAGATVYIALAETGFFPLTLLGTYCADGSILSGHVSHKGVPGVEFSTGSLGHGLSVAAGMALGLPSALPGGNGSRVFVLMGDGECQEGAVWEAALFAAHHKLSNLMAIVDHNKMQGLGFSDDIMTIRPLREKWAAFGWNAVEVDGHNHEQLRQALSARSDERPTCIIAHTTKGKGVSFMENNLLWHYRDPQDVNYTQAVNELESGKAEE